MDNTTDQTKLISANASFRTNWMSSLTDNSTLNIGLIIAIIALVIMAIIFTKTTLGFEIKAVGLNPDASEYAGISAKRTLILSMVVAGALAGLGGVVYGFGYMQTLSLNRHPLISDFMAWLLPFLVVIVLSVFSLPLFFSQFFKQVHLV